MLSAFSATGGGDQRSGACRDADGDGMVQAMLDWLRAWERCQFRDSRRAAGAGDVEADSQQDAPTRTVDRWFAAIALDLVAGSASGPDGPTPKDDGPGSEEDADALIDSAYHDSPLPEAEEEDRRGAGKRLQEARVRAAESHCRPRGAPTTIDPLLEVGDEVADLVEDKMKGGQAPGTARAYGVHWERWKWWARRHGWSTPT